MRPLVLSVMLCGTAAAADWPHWRGAARDGSSAESSRFEEGGWPPGEPVWGAEVGLGSASMLVVGDTVYTLGHRGGKETVVALGAADGKPRWSQSYPAPQYGRHARGDQGFYTGPSATPEFDLETGFLYTMGIDGELRCWDTGRSGAPVWGINLYEEFGIPQRPQVTKRGGSHRDYGYPGSPLVQGGSLLVEAGDPKRGNVLCFDKSNGKLLWGSVNCDPAGHSGGLTPMTVDGVPCVAVLTARNLVVVRLDAANAGKTVASYPWTTDFINNIPCPVAVGQSVLVTSRYNISKMAKLDISLRGGARLAWENKFPSGVCTPVVHDGKIYFANKGFWCIDLSTGRKLWEGGRYGDPGSLILTSDARLIAWANDGDLTLVESASRSPGAYRELAAKRGVLRDMAWPHVVLAGGRVFCKDRGGRIRCLSLSGETAQPSPQPDPAPGLAAPGEFDLEKWPGDSARMVVGWKRGGGKRGVLGALGRSAWVARGDASFGGAGEMLLGGGSFGLAGDVDKLLGPFVASGEMSLEVLLRVADIRQGGPARIVTFSESAYSRNFTLGQERDRLVLRLRTPKTDENGMRPEVGLGSVRAGALYHLVVAYRDGELAAYLNGREVSRTDAVGGGFENWTAQHFRVGDEHDGGRSWRGELQGIALFDKAMDAAAAAKRYAAIAR